MVKPFLSDGMKVGLFGGSFNPPHAGHALVSERLRARLGLDLVWWLVSPQNPLKKEAPESSAMRIDACRDIAGPHKTYISDEETGLGSAYTANTIRTLKKRHPNVHFVWLMGADSMCGIHRWRDWQAIFQQIPVAVYPRPGATVRAGLGPAATCFARNRIHPDDAASLAGRPCPAWTLLEGVMSPLSSTQIRSGRSARKK
ncbi:MAG: nicotinate (nicotinamide) nucleotide adenylyltransferase [Parvibaculales bacterium]